MCVYVCVCVCVCVCVHMPDIYMRACLHGNIRVLIHRECMEGMRTNQKMHSQKWRES